MNLEQYAAQQTQAVQEPQSAPQAQEPLDVLAAKLDADRLYSLLAEAQAVIDGGGKPAAMLEQMTGAVFGTDSPQAAAVAEAIEADQHPGGHELAIAAIRAQKQLLRAQLKQLEGQARAITGELETLDTMERDMIRKGTEAAALDRGLIEVMAFAKDGPRADMLAQMAALYDHHHGNPAAMGLLYGTIADLTRKQYDAAVFDLVQQQAFKDLSAKIRAAIGL